MALSAVVLIISNGCLLADDGSQSLAGRWQVRLDPKNIGMSQDWTAADASFDQTIQLPGTTDQAGLGEPLSTQPILSKEGLSRLHRKSSYVGSAWYRRTFEIPKEWNNQRVILFLERILWESKVWVDGKEIGTRNSLSTAHQFDLTGIATPGKHSLVIRVDNRQQIEIGRSHAYIEDTQSIWNGILGRIELRSTPKVWIEDVRINPNPSAPSADIKIGNLTGLPGSAVLKGKITGKSADTPEIRIPVSWSSEGGFASMKLDLPKGSSPWSEFHPELLRLSLSLENPKLGNDSSSIPFGVRKISHAGPTLLLNDLPLFLRGTHEGASFPLTGYPPMDVEGWRKIFKIVKQWGLNHMRFHSYCPPEACFEAADEEGVYLQAELPLWTGDLGKKKDESRSKWVRDEGGRILKAYGNHPSFILMSLGNELHGQYNFMQTLLQELQKIDPRRLYTMTSNRLWVVDAPDKAGEPGGPVRSDDFLVERALVKNGKMESLRGQGFFNEEPNTVSDYSKSLRETTLPLLTHEIGQWTVFPNLAEIPKYKGVLRPLNLEAIRDDLKKSGMLEQASDFTRASGNFSAELYKQELELALRSTPVAGYQLLDLHDYPGQGTAHIGLLDSFWDSKGIAVPSMFREAAAPVVPIARMPKRVFTSDETFRCALEFVNYSDKPVANASPVWDITTSRGLQIGCGTFTPISLPIGSGIKAGEIMCQLSAVSKPTKATLHVTEPETGARNSWNFWVMPPSPPVNSKVVLVTGSIDEAIRALEKGGRVLFTPSREAIRQRQETAFLPAFWSPVYFTNQPGTMGLLIQKDHPALAEFPTEDHTDWQWWSILTPSPGAVVLDQVNVGNPIVQVIDSFARNQKLGLVLEGRVGNGHLLVCSADLSDKGIQDPVRRQLRSSLVHYLSQSKSPPKNLPAISQQDLLRLFNDIPQSTKKADAVWSKDLEPPPGK